MCPSINTFEIAISAFIVLLSFFFRSRSPCPFSYDSLLFHQFYHNLPITSIVFLSSRSPFYRCRSVFLFALFYRNFQKYCLSKLHICDMQFADVAYALKTQTAISYLSFLSQAAIKQQSRFLCLTAQKAAFSRLISGAKSLAEAYSGRSSSFSRLCQTFWTSSLSSRASSSLPISLS